MGSYCDYFRVFGVAGTLLTCLQYSAGGASSQSRIKWIQKNLNPASHKLADDLRYVVVDSRNRQYFYEGAEALSAYLSDTDRMHPGMIRKGVQGESEEDYGDSAGEDWVYICCVPPAVSQLVMSGSAA